MRIILALLVAASIGGNFFFYHDAREARQKLQSIHAAAMDTADTISKMRDQLEQLADDNTNLINITAK
jgi:hypothetical protein